MSYILYAYTYYWLQIKNLNNIFFNKSTCPQVYLIMPHAKINNIIESWYPKKLPSKPNIIKNQLFNWRWFFDDSYNCITDLRSLKQKEHRCLLGFKICPLEAKLPAVANTQSDPAAVPVGVAQGSTLGPLLFIIHSTTHWQS